MKSIFCNDRTAEVKLAASKRFIKVIVACMIPVAGVFLYEMIAMLTGDRTVFGNIGQTCSSLGALTAALSLNLKRQEELKAEIESTDDANEEF